jgi:2-dehydro-3-deoxyphosphogluconate aldolase/(4S)-4-hydroxy-2-oxoglutarate aldolase
MPVFSETLFQKTPVIGILRGYSKAATLKIVDAYYKAGFTNIEITMNTPDVEAIIEAVVAQFSGKLNIGAGTICTRKELEAVLAAGAQFIVSPILNLELMDACRAQSIPIFPGAYTPTEIYTAWQAGARMVKVFPASLLGPKYIKEVLAPLDQLELMPTGGVNFENIVAYRQAGAKAFGMGSLLFNKKLIEAGDWEGLEVELRKVKERLG